MGLYDQNANRANVAKGQAQDASTLQSLYPFAPTAFTGTADQAAMVNRRGLVCQLSSTGLVLGINTDSVLPFIALDASTDEDVKRNIGGVVASEYGAYVTTSPSGAVKALPVAAPYEIWTTAYKSDDSFAINSQLGSPKTGTSNGLVALRTTGQTLIGFATGVKGAIKGGYPNVTALPMITNLQLPALS